MVNVIRYLQTCGVAQAVQLLQNCSLVCLFAKKYRSIPKCYVLCSVEILRDWPVLWEGWTKAQKGHNTPTGQVSRLPVRWFRRSLARSIQNDLLCGTEGLSDQTVRNWFHSNELSSRHPIVGLILTPSTVQPERHLQENKRIGKSPIGPYAFHRWKSVQLSCIQWTCQGLEKHGLSGMRYRPAQQVWWCTSHGLGRISREGRTVG